MTSTPGSTRRRTVGTLVGGFVAGSLVGVAGTAGWAAVSAGGLTGVPPGLVGTAAALPGLVAAPAAADGLPAFDDCEQLRRWYVDRALAEVGPWGLSGSPVLDDRRETWGTPKDGSADGALRQPAPSAGTAGDAVEGSDTGTNVQEADVDESDVAKTDGRLVVRISGRSVVVDDVSGSRVVELSRTDLPGPALSGGELLLDRDRVVVVGNAGVVRRGGPVPGEGWTELPRPRLLPGPVEAPRTRIATLDLADPSAPRWTSDRTVDGRLVSARQHADGTVRVVAAAGAPRLRFTLPSDGVDAAEATRRNRTVVREAPLDAWLPEVASASGSREHVSCSDVRHPREASGLGTVSVLALDPDRPEADPDVTAVAASGDLVYAAAERLYVATTSTATSPSISTSGGGSGRASTVHAFALDGDRTTYVGSGSLPGTVRDRWSFSAYDGHLRVATAIGDVARPRENAVVVLDERDGRLVETGRVDGIGVDEQIKAVRWFGDVAVVVTFRQTDPLHTLDLSDPARPRVVGELEVPGFSAYLHPVGDDLLVGLGRDADADGVDRGAQASTFDLGDPTAVRRVATLGLGAQAALGAESDPRTVAYLPRQRLLLTTLEDWSGAASGRTRVVALHVGRGGTLRETASWPVPGEGGPGTRALPLDGGRVALVGAEVTVVRAG